MSFTNFLWFFLIGCAFAHPQIDNRIIGGSIAPNGAYPYQVSIRYNLQHNCGGSIISSRYILTAAHCLYNKNPLLMKVVTGSNTLNSGGTVYDVSRGTIHENYQPFTLSNDIALLYLMQTIQFNPRVQAVVLSGAGSPPGEVLTLSGWGSTVLGGASPNNLMHINLHAISLEQCAINMANINNGHICTQESPGRGACHGDSGGPLVISRNKYQAGIVSRGEPCAIGYPDVFTSVPAFQDWIISHTRIGPAPMFADD